jgi:hypothetical protein
MTQTSTPTAQPALDPIFAVDEVRQTVNYIRSLAACREYADAAICERTLHARVLEGIASGTAQAGWLAAAALESRSIDFPRTNA